MNEKDEEGRSRPEVLTVDNDVGRTVLRRALPEDLSRIRKLFASEAGSRSKTPPQSGSFPSDGSQFESPNGFSLTRLWSESSIVVLLCRAIAPHEDPPLGCAVLSPGFSMEHGRILYLTRIASEPHLPRERFIECLQGFASAMKYKLGEEDKYHTSPNAAKAKLLDSEELKMISESYLVSVDCQKKPPPEGTNNSFSSTGGSGGGGKKTYTIKRVTSPLQSVQEESEVSESSAEKRATKTLTTGKRSNKPSKRSRFA